MVSPTFLIDAYYGYTRMDTSSEQTRLEENLGCDFLGIPGTNDNFMPYYRRDPQYQYVANFNWTKGAHNVRFGFDL